VEIYESVTNVLVLSKNANSLICLDRKIEVYDLNGAILLEKSDRFVWLLILAYCGGNVKTTRRFPGI
jgi:hypothetical protein